MYYIVNVIIWTLALYGLFEILKTVLYNYFSYKKENTYFIIVLKKENKKIQSAKVVDWEECKKIIGLKV